jgi:hypothetical protein
LLQHLHLLRVENREPRLTDRVLVGEHHHLRAVGRVKYEPRRHYRFLAMDCHTRHFFGAEELFGAVPVLGERSFGAQGLLRVIEDLRAWNRIDAVVGIVD